MDLDPICCNYSARLHSIFSNKKHLFFMAQTGACVIESIEPRVVGSPGHMSYYAGQAWCAAASRVLAVDRAPLRHKRDNRLRGRSVRLRADLAHLALERVPVLAQCAAVVGLAKHLCGVATGNRYYLFKLPTHIH